MKHLGDIAKIDGAEITPVDCITFGSPCQDLSIAGRRAGLDGERSGLFMQAVRVIKEMREATHELYPAFAVWENVPGAFSSNGGEDFRTVLEELARIAEPGITIPRPDRGGKWQRAGYMRGHGWSLAWRLLDAQYWGVPQRRKRIALVMDFRGQRAGEILFEREGVRGNPAQSCPPWQGIARNPADGAGANRIGGGKCFDARGNGRGNIAPTVTGDHNGHVSDYTAVVCEAYTLKIRTGCAGGGKGALVQTEKSATLSTLQDQTLFAPDIAATLKGRADSNLNEDGGTTFVREPCYCLQGNGIDRADTAGCNGAGWRTGESYTLNTVDRPAVVYGIDRAAFNQGVNAKYDFAIEPEREPTLVARGANAVCAPTVSQSWIARRLTPTECERLQGFPDGWTDLGEWTDSKGKLHKPADTPRYKALGNSIALPQWWWLVCKMTAYLPEKPTLGSLFDGIGGFPLVWETRHGKGTAVWASEIEEFCIAVTKARFAEN